MRRNVDNACGIIPIHLPLQRGHEGIYRRGTWPVSSLHVFAPLPSQGIPEVIIM
jgi:hypothetical protein